MSVERHGLMSTTAVCPRCSRSMPCGNSEVDEELVCRYCGETFTPQDRSSTRGQATANGGSVGVKRVIGACARCGKSLHFAKSLAGLALRCKVIAGNGLLSTRYAPNRSRGQAQNKGRGGIGESERVDQGPPTNRPAPIQCRRRIRPRRQREVTLLPFIMSGS